MGNATNKFQEALALGKTWTQFLTTAIGNGTINDLLGTTKVDQNPGTVSEVPFGQVNKELMNLIDDGLEASYESASTPATGSTTDATPLDVSTVGTVPDGGTLYVEGKVWGKKATQDLVYIDFAYRYERDGASVTEDADRHIVQYSSGGTLTTAAAAPAAVGATVSVFVLGEAATTITWEGYVMKRTVTFV